jgi:hypothetical protein
VEVKKKKEKERKRKHWSWSFSICLLDFIHNRRNGNGIVKSCHRVCRGPQVNFPSNAFLFSVSSPSVKAFLRLSKPDFPCNLSFSLSFCFLFFLFFSFSFFFLFSFFLTPTSHLYFFIITSRRKMSSKVLLFVLAKMSSPVHLNSASFL